MVLADWRWRANFPEGKQISEYSPFVYDWPGIDGGSSTTTTSHPIDKNVLSSLDRPGHTGGYGHMAIPIGSNFTVILSPFHALSFRR
jgi:hypothetical protein